LDIRVACIASVGGRASIHPRARARGSTDEGEACPFRREVQCERAVVSLEIIINIGVAWTINLPQRLDNNKRITGTMEPQEEPEGTGRAREEREAGEHPRSG